MPSACAQCGEITELRRGRCGACGAAVDLSEIARYQRRAAVLRVVGEEWYEWLGEIVALALIGLVLLDVLPAWTLAIAAALLLRPLSRLVLLLARGSLDQLPG